MTRRPASGARGATLLELLVALAVVGAMAGVAGLAFRAVDDAEPPTAREEVAIARRRAVAERRPVVLTVRQGERVVSVTAMPDGSVVADTALGIDPASGRPRVAPE